MSMIEGVSITWVINNCIHFWPEMDEEIASPVFFIYMPEETKWKLIIVPLGTNYYVPFLLYRNKDCNGSENIEVEYNLEILADDDSTLEYASNKNVFRNDERHGSEKLIPYTFILAENSALPPRSLKLRCRITRIAGKKLEIRQIYAHTTIDVVNQSCLWSIDNYSNLTPNQKQTYAVQSPSKKILVYIDLYASKDCESDDKIYLTMYSYNHRVKFSILKIAIVDSYKQKKNSSVFHCWFHNGKRKRYSLKLTKKQLLDNDCLYLPNDTLTLCLDFTITLADERIEKVNALVWRKCIAQEKVSDSPCALIADLASMHMDQNSCDMNLQTKTTIFPVHTFMLSARSLVFKAMFSHLTQHKINGFVDVSDIDDETIRRFLLYLYTNQLENFNFEDTVQLYKMADKYEVFSLKEKCSTILKCNLNPENALEALVLSDLHQDQDLKLTVQKLILENAGIIFNSEEWQLLADTNSKLVIETMLLNWIEE